MVERRIGVNNFVYIKGSPINTVSRDPARNLSDIRAKHRKIREGLGITTPKK